LPCSSETIAARSSIRALTSSRNANSTLVRFDSDESPHDWNALPATSTALSTSDASASRTAACCSPVAGFHTGAVRVDAPEVSAPPIQCWTVLMTRISLEVRALRALRLLVGGPSVAG
jgi:hypothetical protein